MLAGEREYSTWLSVDEPRSFKGAFETLPRQDKSLLHLNGGELPIGV